MVRPGSSLPAGVEPAPITDLADRQALRRAVTGVDTVIHLAARVHVMRDTAADPLAEFRRVNVDGTRTLLEEAAAAGVRRFLLASSVKAMGEESHGVWTERSPALPVDPYGVSKLEAETVVREIASAAGMHAPILRLPLVYGPGIKGNMLRLFELVERGVPLPFGGVRNRRSLLFIGNAVDAMIASLDTPAAGAGVFLVSDGEDLSTPDLIRAIATALGTEPRLISVPEGMFRWAARTGDRLLTAAHRRPRFSAALGRLLGSLAVDITALTQACGFKPRFTVAQGLKVTAEWYRSGASAGSVNQTPTP